ncbi:MAG: hypothetical protein JWQ68_2111 [Cryobacterium sp.]|jgi:hypothetical protein|nr:hypothetical protein [Cryobacterium sp.]
MQTPTPLELLHTEYERLAARDPATPTHVQRRSVKVYLTEVGASDSKSRTCDSQDRVIRWVHSLLDLEAFITREGRWPRENNRLPADAFLPGERRLANWVRSERRAAQALRRCSYQRVRLAAVPGYTRFARRSSGTRS